MLRGAIVAIDPMNPLASIILFQYNPHEVERRLAVQAVGASGAGGGGEGVERSEPMRLRGAPVETLSMTIDLDATDQLERGDPIAMVSGITPQLAALEMLVYPKMATVIQNTVRLATGVVEIVQQEAPFTLLVWGPMRVVPVRVQDFSIREKAFDPMLNPIQATVTLSLRVLSYNDLPLTHPGYGVFLAHQAVKEAMAVVGSLGNVAGAISGSASVKIG